MNLNHPGRPFWDADSNPELTDESDFLNRRSLIKGLAATGATTWMGSHLSSDAAVTLTDEDKKFHIPDHKPSLALYPAAKNPKFTDPGRAVTKKNFVYQYCNFYEFSLRKDPHRYVQDFEPFPWQIEFSGLCDKPGVHDIDDLFKKLTLEERSYRFRCVEAWAMTVPWTGFPLADLIKLAAPQSKATFVRFVSFFRPKQARGQKYFTDYQWPYFEGLHIKEALHPLSFVATGAYGKPLPKQNGSPLRIILPWKYGFKGPKSIVKIEFTDKQPTTFWNEAYAAAYGFYSNVDPKKPHPNWSQAEEKILGTSDKVPTQSYNGYTKELEELHSSIYLNGTVF